MKKLLILILVTSTFFFGRLDAQIMSHGVPIEQYEALCQIYDALDGANWDDNENWKSDLDVGEWYGVSVYSSTFGKGVHGLSLRNNKLKGELPATAFAKLPELIWLYLDNNTLTGSIPQEIGNLLHCSSIWLYANNFSGSLPVFKADSYYIIWISNNNISGTLTGKFSESDRVSNLRLNSNEIGGEIPEEMFTKKIQEFDLSNNDLTGQIPSVHCDYLWILRLANNNLSGEFPDDFYAPKLYEFSVGGNNFTGSLPQGLVDAGGLVRVSCNNNEFDELPVFTSAAIKLMYLVNNQFDFDDLEPNHNLSNMVVNPQAKFGTEQHYEVQPGEYQQVTMDAGGSSTTYCWYVNGEIVASTAGNTMGLYETTPGTYEMYCVATNSLLPRVTLTSETAYITVIEPPLQIWPDLVQDNPCPGASKGIVEITVHFGVPPYSYLWNDGSVLEDRYDLPTGTHTLTVTDASGAKVSMRFGIYSAPADLNCEIEGETTVMYGYQDINSTDLTATNLSGGTPPYNFLWSTGETTSTITVKPTTATTYSLTIIDASGCQYSTSHNIEVVDIRCGKNLDKVIMCKTTGGKHAKQHEICVSRNAVPAQLMTGAVLGSCSSGFSGGIYTDGNTDVHIYPNPASGKFTLELGNYQEMDISVEIVNAMGSVVFVKSIPGCSPNFRMAIQLHKLTPGMYFVRVVTPGELLSKTLIIN